MHGSANSLLPPAAADCAAVSPLTKSKEQDRIIINRSGRSTYTGKKSVQTSGATAECFPRLAGYRYVLLEYDDERSGSFAALGDLPRDCCAVLGLISTKHARLEPLDLLMQRIDAASRHFPREQLAVSPQCGFASAIFGNPVTFEIEEQKLRRVGACAARLAVGR